MNQAIRIALGLFIALATQSVYATDAIEAATNTADLPPMLKFADGSPVKTQEDWLRRRDEIRRLMIETFVGTFPTTTPAILDATVVDEHRDDNRVLRRRVKLTFDTKNKATFELCLWIPEGDGPFPVLLVAPRFYQVPWAEAAVQRGYIAVLYPGVDSSHHEADYPDYENVWNTFRAEYPEATWTELSTKAWLASRAMDYVLDPKVGYAVAKDQVAIIGHSRYGKQSLIAAAFDDRITSVVARSSGTPGGVPYRFGSWTENCETPNGFPAEWFLASLRSYSGRENELPIDAHGWLALIAPRRCLLHTAYNDDGDPTFGTERAYLEGRKVYEFLGHPSDLYLDYRQGGHNPITDEHRRRNLDWMDQSFARGDVRDDAFPEPALLHHFDWSSWKARQSPHDLQPPSATADVRSRIDWLLGQASADATPTEESPFLTRQQEIERFGEDRDPDRWSSPNVARTPVMFGNGIRGCLYYNTTTEGPMPVVVWLHPFSYPTGYCSAYEAVIPWGQTPAQTPYHYIAAQGFAVLAFDQIGFGERLLEGRDFYEHHPHWSKLGRMVCDVQAAVDFLVDGRGRAQDELPRIDTQKIYLLGYSLGGTVALHAAALDPRIAGVACFSGFTPLRTDTDAKPTGGIRRLWQWHGLLPKLGLYDGREGEIPCDYDDLLSLVAPRPCLIVAPQRDRYASFAEVEACVDRARQAWTAASRPRSLVFLSPDDFSHFQSEQHNTLLDWLTHLDEQ